MVHFAFPIPGEKLGVYLLWMVAPRRSIVLFRPSERARLKMAVGYEEFHTMISPRLNFWKELSSFSFQMARILHN